MSAIEPECIAYSAGRRDEVLDLWNRTFLPLRNFLPFDRKSWRRRIEDFSMPHGGIEIVGAGPTHFEPDLLRLAIHEGRVVGLAHGGIWEDAFLARLLPGGQNARVGTLLVIAVDPLLRRRGIGRALLTDLERTLDRTRGTTGSLRADGRGYNPFYGNFLAPVAPPWGTPEGIALPADDAAATAFFRATGFSIEAEAVTRTRSLTDRPRFTGSVPEGSVIEEVENWQPILGTDDGTEFPLPNASRSWVLRDGDRQLGAIVAFPLGEDGRRWGIHSFEVDSARRGEGLGRLLLEYTLAALASRGVKELEALALPEEAPEADHLYERAGFAMAEGWLVLG